ncbi:insulin receptor substrate 1-like isoform X2 [Photinus pyralis]|uniref:insulin receptor substrate 1-like isoform X2 n=1 Tax=Photinus pyralis TaxID=7054 RepID=UPI0012674383|nr:insulin receptor substrate 1-like isoform X2 [Photinus pyralis]
MSVKSSNSNPGSATVVRAGYLKKLKTFKKKYFVLRAEGPESSARLEYYDSEKKFNNGLPPKRSIPLKTCFNINKRVDTKHKHVIALYTKDDCFCLVLESEDELEAWLKALLSLQHGEEAADGETPRPTFEHVWQVTVLNRGLGGTSVIGAYSKGQESTVFRLCLTDRTLSLIRKDRESPQAELSLSSIRSCGSIKNFFYLEVGRSSVTGAGELWMETEDANIAQNVHETVFHAMSSSSSSKDELGPPRIRSSSATESSKPGRKQTHSGATKYHHAQDGNPQVNETLVPATTSSSHIAAGGVPWPKTVNHQRTQSLPLAQITPLTEQPLQPKRAAKRSNQSFRCTAGNGRERCDSMPTRARTSSEGTHSIHAWCQPRAYLAHRPQSLYAREISHSPPTESPISPPSAACSTDSAGSSLSIDDSEQWAESDTILGRYGHSLTPDEAIAEENYDDCPDSPYLPQGASPSGYLPMAPISSDDGYVDMSPRGRHANMSPAASTSSITSGTPSTDMRFAEYPLEKVSAYFPPTEDDKGSVDRPIRAYSVGSRPDTVKSKARYEMSTTPENARVRAFSVGSKTRKLHTRVLPPHGTVIHPKPKSSSAPLLSGSRILVSHNSEDRMNDLMELDFSKPVNSGYLDMNPANKVPSGYVEMKPVHHDAMQTSDVSPYVDMRSGSSPAKATSDYIPIQAPKPNVYMDMDPRRSSSHERPDARAKDTKNLDSPVTRHNDYLDMNFQSKNKTYSSSPNDYPMDNSMDYMDMGYHSRITENKPTTVDGYVEMSLGRQTANHQRQPSLESAKSDHNEDYTDMSLGTTSRKNERRTSKKDKTASQPILIQAVTTAAHFPKNSSSISPIYSSFQIGRKYSTGTPPKMYLPLSSSDLNSYSSLPRQRSRKNSRRDSKDSSSSSVTTPSSSSTIFPFSLNSPSSPLKPCASMKTPEVSGNIKIPAAIMSVKYNRPSTKPNNSADYTVMDFDRAKKSMDTSDYVNYNPATSSVSKCNTSGGDYAIMRPGTLEIVQPTTEPKISIPVSSPSALTSQLSSMVLGKSALNYDFGMAGARCFLPISEARDDSRLLNMSPRPGDVAPSEDNSNMDESDYMLSGDCQSPVAKISRPNSVNSDCISRSTSRPASVSCELTRASVSRPNSAASEFGSSSSTVVGSRPASVNSDRIRPASVSFEGQLHYASLDLAPTFEEEGSRSPRTVKSTSGNAPTEISNTSPTQQIPETGFTYAEIDFIKSEGFKHNSLPPNNTKVKH